MMSCALPGSPLAGKATGYCRLGIHSRLAGVALVGLLHRNLHSAPGNRLAPPNAGRRGSEGRMRTEAEPRKKSKERINDENRGFIRYQLKSNGKDRELNSRAEQCRAGTSFCPHPPPFPPKSSTFHNDATVNASDVPQATPQKTAQEKKKKKDKKYAEMITLCTAPPKNIPCCLALPCVCFCNKPLPLLARAPGPQS